jgi:hypothetical protein
VSSIIHRNTPKPKMNDDAGNIDGSDELPPYMEALRKQFGNDALHGLSGLWPIGHRRI